MLAGPRVHHLGSNDRLGGEPRPDARSEELRIRQRIARRFATKTEELRFGDLYLNFTRVADPDRVLDEVADEEARLEKLTGRRADADQLHLPYWAEVWDSAVGIGEYLMRVQGSGFGVQERQRPSNIERSPNPSMFDVRCSVFDVQSTHLKPEPRTLNPRSVLDLGCGMGLAGTVAAALGHRVLFADLESPALLFARLNSLPWKIRVETRRINWRNDRIDASFDTILGADILYEREQWPFLEPFWREHLATDGTVLLAEPGRQTGDMFIEWIGSKGWSLEVHEQPIKPQLRPMQRGSTIRRIRILELTL